MADQGGTGSPIFMIKNSKIIISLVIAGLVVGAPVLAYVMSNDYYNIQIDSINFAGGLSSSSDYNLEDTLGEVGSGYSGNAYYDLSAGYQQPDQFYLALTTVDKVSLTPFIFGVTGGTARGSAQVLVKTNSPGGYTLMARASGTPALIASTTGDFFYNYRTASAGVPDLEWNINSASSSFGFTVDGSDIVQKYRDDGIDCNQTTDIGSPDTCWSELSATDETVAYGSTYNHETGGTITTMSFRAESGTANVQPPGLYEAYVTVTAFMN